MLAEDGQLCLNISHSSSSSSSFRRKPASAQQRWAMKKQRAEKRRVSSSEVKGHSFKKRREEPEAPPPEVKGHSFKKKREEPEAPPPEVKGHSFKKRREEPEAPPPEVKGHVSPEIKPIDDAVHQAPPPEDTDQTPEKKKKKKKTTLKKEKDGGLKEAGPKGVKTSSLFKHNPQIPQMDIPVVSPLKEQIFSSSSFSVLDLHPHLVATLDKVLNVSTLTSVQKQTVPVLLSGRDAVVRSQTGSGKTLSYAVPVVQSLQALRPKVSRSHGPLALVIVPTRELAVQTFQTFQTLLKPFTWIVPGVLMGGEKRKAEKARLRKGINILVSTPGRLVDHVKHTLSLVFSSVRWLVLDEADRTLDLGFEKDLTVIFNSLNSTGPSRQNVLLSATLTNGVTRLADICLNDPVAIHVSGPASFDSTPTPVVKPDPDATDQSQSFAIPEALQQFVVVVPSKVRLVCLAAFILDKCKFSQDNKLIVFASSCQMVEFLHSLFSSVLCRPSANHQAELSFLRLHGNMKQEERSEVFQQFSAACSGVLLCTDVAARGLHLPQVTWIVQFTPPTAAADYVHRVGRTARVGHRGSSLLFLTPAENAFVTELANHNISLSEMKLLDILSSLMMDDAYKGRGKYHSQSSASAREQEVRERATVLQTQLEDAVHADAQTLQTAKAALQSFVRAYAAYPARLKHIFHVRSLHLGHAAKSFGLRDAPRGLGVAAATHNRKSHHGKQNQNQRQRAGKTPRADPPGKKRYSDGQRESGLICSEFSSGLDTLKKNKKKKRRKALIGQTAEGEESE